MEGVGEMKKKEKEKNTNCSLSLSLPQSRPDKVFTEFNLMTLFLCISSYSHSYVSISYSLRNFVIFFFSFPCLLLILLFHILLISVTWNILHRKLSCVKFFDAQYFFFYLVLHCTHSFLTFPFYFWFEIVFLIIFLLLFYLCTQFSYKM